mgnify:CR=1 FL=1
MTSHRPFRFGVQADGARTRADWADLARRAEHHGYSCLTMPDHFGDQLAPVPALMAAGVPLACSSIAPHREVVGKTAILFDPLDEGALEAAMERVTSPDAATSPLVSAARERAREFSWERAAEETLAALIG